jgi:hypothetical protein
MVKKALFFWKKLHPITLKIDKEKGPKDYN